MIAPFKMPLLGSMWLTLFSLGLSSDIGPGHHVVLEVKDTGSLGRVHSTESTEMKRIEEAQGQVEGEERALLDDQEDIEREMQHRAQLQHEREEEDKRQQPATVMELLGEVSADASDASAASTVSLQDQLRLAALQYRADSGLGDVNRDGNDCIAALTKAKAILDYHVVALTARGRSAGQLPNLVANLTTAVTSGSVPSSTVFLSNVSAALSGVPLTEGLQAGFVWTSEDQYVFSALCAGSGIQSHPEENPPPSSENAETKLYHGDIGVVNELVGMAVDPESGSPVGNGMGQFSLPWNAHNNWASLLTSTGNRANSTVAYCLTRQFSDSALKALDLAIAHITQQVACLQFVRASLSSSGAGCAVTPSVLITNDETAGCWSNFGQVITQGTSQYLNIGTGCDTMGMVLHQLGHLLGLGHEVSRIDRDNFLSFNQGGATTAYSMFPLNTANIPVLAFANSSFDYLSIMMPSAFSFVNMDTNVTSGTPAFAPTMHPLRMIYFYMGQRMSLSAGDVYKLNELHGCPGPIATPITPSNDLMENWNKGRGFVITGNPCMDHPGNFRCSSWQTCWDTTSPHYASFRIACQNSCLQCLQAPATISQLALAYLRQIRWTNATHKEAANLAAGGCFDEPITGITFLDGAPASCDQLVHYCNDPNMGAEVQSACTLTCGLCPLQSVAYIKTGTKTASETETKTEAETEAETETGCHDMGDGDKPQFLIQGVPQPCPALISYCSGTPQSSLVIKKCPLTCGFCIGTPSPPPTTEMPQWNPEFDWSNYALSVTNASGMSTDCDRRRRFGFCADRRRRDNMINGADVDPADT